MAEQIRIIGVHSIVANEPCYLVEIELKVPLDEFDFGAVTQEVPDHPKDNWQVAWDEQQIGDEDTGFRYLFFFHYLEFDRPLLTPLGPIPIPEPTPLPDHLKEIDYDEP